MLLPQLSSEQKSSVDRGLREHSCSWHCLRLPSMGSIAGTVPGTLRCAKVLMAHGVAGTATVGGGQKGVFKSGG